MPFQVGGLDKNKLREVTTRNLKEDRISQGGMPVIPRGKDTYRVNPAHRNWQIETAVWNLAGFLHFF